VAVLALLFLADDRHHTSSTIMMVIIATMTDMIIITHVGAIVRLASDHHPAE
jgi:hypothetical protein